MPADTRFSLETLTPRTLDLLREVEGGYKQPINIVWVERLEPEDRLGEADITPDGAPVIRVRRSAPQMSASPLEETIIHELFHLRLIADGFPALRFQLDYGKVSATDEQRKANDKVFDNVRIWLWDPILHWVFFPDIRRLGYDAGFPRSENIASRIKNKDTKGLETPYGQAQYLYQSLLEVDDAKSIGDLIRWYMSQQWLQGLVLGTQMVEAVKAMPERTPETALAALRRIIEIVNEGRVSVADPTLSTARRGATSVRVATFRVRINV